VASQEALWSALKPALSWASEIIANP
jgi:hypothetical protein